MAESFINDTYPKSYYDTVVRMQDKDDLKTKTRAWMSKPRMAESNVSEVLTFTFGGRSSISAISFDILSVGCEYEFTYIDSDGIELPLLKDDYNEIRFTVQSKEDWTAWQRWSFNCLPCIATKLRIKMTRVKDDNSPDEEFSVGMRNLAIKRTITTRADAALGFRPNIDSLGNKISRVVKDWQPDRAIDESTETYWKSEPQVSQDAVVCLYLDIRDDAGNAQYFDDIALDPVYMGSQMNIYYSSDDTIGERLVSFDVHDFVIDGDWVEGSGYSNEKNGKDLVTLNSDIKDTQFDKNGSWCMYASWWAIDKDALTHGKLSFGTTSDDYWDANGVSIYFEGNLAKIRFPGKLSVNIKNMSENVEYRRGNPDTSNIDTQIMFGFGMDRNHGDKFTVRWRVVNYWRSSGKVKSAFDYEKSFDIDIEVSKIFDAINADFTPEEGSGLIVHKDKSEVEIPPHTHFEIPLDKMVDVTNISAIENGDYLQNKIVTELTYRTNEKYLGNGLLTITESKDGVFTWWAGDENNSESKLVHNGRYIATNWFWNPFFSKSGGWSADIVSGNYYASWDEKPVDKQANSISRLYKDSNLIASNIVKSPKPQAAAWSKTDSVKTTLADTQNGMSCAMQASDSRFGFDIVEGLKEGSYEISFVISGQTFKYHPLNVYAILYSKGVEVGRKTIMSSESNSDNWKNGLISPVSYDLDIDGTVDRVKIQFENNPENTEGCSFVLSNVFMGTFADWLNMLNNDIFWFDGDSTFTDKGGVEVGFGNLVITGRTRARNFEKPPVSIPANTRMVFSALPEFSGDVIPYKDYGLFVYDGTSERYLGFSPSPKSGQRISMTFTTPSDTRLLSFGFVGASADGWQIKWSKPMLCTEDEYLRNKDLIDNRYQGFFAGDSVTEGKKISTIGRYCDDLNINPANDPDAPVLGTIGAPSWTIDRSFNGNIVYLEPGDNVYHVNDWIWAIAGQTFVFSFYTKSLNGFSRPQPFFEDQDKNQFWPDRYTYSEDRYGWQLVYARVSIPSGHKSEWMHFGIRESMPDAHTYMGGLHVYDNSDAFQARNEVTKMSLEMKEMRQFTMEHLQNLFHVIVYNTSDTGSIFVRNCSVKFVGDSPEPPRGTHIKTSVDGVLEDVVVKQDAMPSSKDDDKFLQNPKRYLSPESYDRSSTLNNALIYGKFDYEPVLRGGTTDSMYMAKEWTPALTGQKLEKQTYYMPMPFKAKYVKFEFSQLTAVQYPMERTGIVSRYRVFPVDAIEEMKRNSLVDSSVHNDKGSVSGGMDVDSARALVAAKFPADPSQTGESTEALYANPDTEVLVGKNPTQYIPDSEGRSLWDVTRTETTSSAYYTGSGDNANLLSTGSGDDKRTTLYQDNADYAVYYAEANESLISLARRFHLSDWKLLYDINDYVDDTVSRQSIPGRMPGYWIMPGQQVRIPISQVRQMVSDSDVQVVRRSALTRAVTTVDDNAIDGDVAKTVGPVAFSKTCVHHYQTKDEKRTKSIAYFVGLRDIKVRIVDLLSEHDNVSWNFFSMDMPVWHIRGGYLTSSSVFVPDFSTGNDMAVAETDMMHSQSYYRTVKLISTNHNSLTNRTYLNLSDTTAWHAADYWELHPELNCTWDSDVKPDPRIPEDNGGAWLSRRFAWGDMWTMPTTPGKHEEVWYDNELVQHIKVEPQDRQFDENGNQIPYVIELGSLYIPKESMTRIGVSLYSLSPSSNVPSELETRLSLVSGRYGNENVIDEGIGFKSDYLLNWQEFATSRKRLQDMRYKCRIRLSFNHFDHLDLFIKSPYIETGTMRVLMRNTSHVNEDDWEDVTAALDEGKSEYTFKVTGHDMQIRVEELDGADWFSSLRVIPLYIPYEDAVDYISDTIHSSFIFDDKSGGKPSGNSMRMGETRMLSVSATYEDSSVKVFPGNQVKWQSTAPGVASVDESGKLTAVTPGKTYIRGVIGGYTTPPLEIDVSV